MPPELDESVLPDEVLVPSIGAVLSFPGFADVSVGATAAPVSTVGPESADPVSTVVGLDVAVASEPLVAGATTVVSTVGAETASGVTVGSGAAGDAVVVEIVLSDVEAAAVDDTAGSAAGATTAAATTGGAMFEIIFTDAAGAAVSGAATGSGVGCVVDAPGRSSGGDAGAGAPLASTTGVGGVVEPGASDTGSVPTAASVDVDVAVGATASGVPDWSVTACAPAIAAASAATAGAAA